MMHSNLQKYLFGSGSLKACFQRPNDALRDQDKEQLALGRASRMRRILAFGGLLLLGSTWKLWTPQQDFPRIPLFRVAEMVPETAEWMGAGLLLLALLIVLVSPWSSHWRQRGLLLFAGTIAAMIVLNQHRLQPWAYQFAMMAGVLSVLSPQRALTLLRLFVVSIYFHSALSKLSAGFLESTGPMLIAGLVKVLEHLGFSGWLKLEQQHSVLLPLGELLVALLLGFSWSRRIGLWVSLGMHVLLLLVVGPWGLNHQPGVLIWNVFFLAQNIVLFGPLLPDHDIRGKTAQLREREEKSTQPATNTSSVSLFGRLAQGVVVAAILLPCLEPYGLFDQWPSWAVYSGSTERVTVYVDGATRKRLPEAVQRYVSRGLTDDSWCLVFAGRWSLDVLSAPIYPGDRFGLGTALWLAHLAESEEGIRVVVDSRAGRWTGKRSAEVIDGTTAIERRVESFWCNGFPIAPHR
jgi:hypothetical protein